MIDINHKTNPSDVFNQNKSLMMKRVSTYESESSLSSLTRKYNHELSMSIEKIYSAKVRFKYHPFVN